MVLEVSPPLLRWQFQGLITCQLWSPHRVFPSSLQPCGEGVSTRGLLTQLLSEGLRIQASSVLILGCVDLPHASLMKISLHLILTCILQLSAKAPRHKLFLQLTVPCDWIEVEVDTIWSRFEGTRRWLRCAGSSVFPGFLNPLLRAQQRQFALCKLPAAASSSWPDRGSHWEFSGSCYNSPATPALLGAQTE